MGHVVCCNGGSIARSCEVLTLQVLCNLYTSVLTLRHFVGLTLSLPFAAAFSGVFPGRW
jgi:hypothetical protein